MRLIVAVAVLSFSAGVLFPRRSAEAPRVYADPLYGFSLEVPRFEVAKEGATAPIAVFYAPASDGMAPNINCLVESKAYTAEEYKKVTLDGLLALKMTMNSQKEIKVGGRDAFLFDYEGKQNDRLMRHVALAVLDSDRVLLTTCTALKEQFADHEKQFRAGLDSFKMTSPPPKPKAGKDSGK